MNETSYANIMMIGRTGVGKSSFLNYLLNTNKFKTGVGRPVTPGFETLECDDVEGIPIRVYDSKGLEVKDFPTIKNDLLNYLKTQCNNTDPMKWIHSIFYCISVKKGRFEPTEEEFIKDICNSVFKTVHIVLTKCDSPDSEQVIKMENYIRSVLNNPKVKIIKVNSVKTDTLKCQAEPFGRKEALDTIFCGLWSDMAEQFSKKYASEVVRCMHNAYGIVFNELEQCVDEINTFSVIKAVIENGELTDNVDYYLNRAEDDFDKQFEILNKKYLSIINPLIKFCNNYSESFGYKLSLFEYSDFLDLYDNALDIVDIEQILSNSRMGRLMEEMENMDFDNESIWIQFKMIAKGVGMLIRVKSLCKEIFDEIRYEVFKSFPSEKEIVEDIYNKLMRQIDCIY